MSKVVHTWRCLLCDLLVSWSIRIAPVGYTPSFIEATVKANDEGFARGYDAAHEEHEMAI